MPLSSNAPFSEFGQSMILRDIEQLYLALNGAGAGSSGESQTQDQSVSQDQSTGDSGAVPDLSGLASIAYVNAAIDAIPDVSYPISIANGGTGQVTNNLAVIALGLSVYTSTELITTTGAYSWTVPSGVTRVCIEAWGAGGGGGFTTATSTTVGYIASSSGGSPTTTLTGTEVSNGGAGGMGGYCYIIVPVTPGEVISGSIGAHGVAGSSPTGATAGGNTTVTVNSVSDAYVTASGGAAAGNSSGNQVEGGLGGAVTISGSRVFYDRFVHYGGNGGDGTKVRTIVTTAYPIASSSQIQSLSARDQIRSRALSAGSIYGLGGRGQAYLTAASADGSDGAVIISY